ncbi:cellulose synthase complex periplasmic endoglucanase BcsZ [Herbaspirillum rhizosphaerae]|uniref:cellulose synthase complex periplasmic endoglucanase BcsZ n=1 Tax=Herbaspirillum rhizosphaerae TaxID=346179 RepID=UPI00067D0274|nr:cellulose synthase complex periplasmic endoglucanase BcsZ [Herbaspirillum rhizosphaerae]
MMLRRDFLAASAALALSATAGPAMAQSCKAWPQWQAFVQHHIQSDGRVVDQSVANQQSTSEGQSYGMFFALVANDREQFARLWRWSRDNLGAGSDRLPAWQWGKRDNGSYGVLDPNSASDADLWFAYALLEAGRLWRMLDYQKAGMALLAQIKDKEITDLPKLGAMLLPGPEGFALANETWRLNPSYLPLPLLRKLARVDAAGPWNALIGTAQQLIRSSSPQGYVPDWAAYQAVQGFMPDEQTRGIGSYDAIRTYLWAGMTDDGDPLAQAWRNSLQGMARHVAANGAPPEKVDTVSGAAEGKGPVGFSAGLLPYLRSLKLDAALKGQQQLVQEQWSKSSDQGYYNSVLMLFGWGWEQGQYRFAADGDLQPSWLSCMK